MFYCEPCRKKRDWPTGLRGYPLSRGKCECCGKTEDCYDVPSSALPLPSKRKPTQKSAGEL